MKKKLFYLLLAGTVVTTSPLLAMRDGEDGHEENKIIPAHQCAACSEEMQFVVKEDEGASFPLPNDVAIHIISYLSPQDLCSVSLASKAMYNLCHVPLIWQQFALNKGIIVNPPKCPKEKYIDFTSDTKLFSDNTRSYTVTIEKLQFWKKEKYPSERSYSWYFPQGKNYCHMWNSQTGPDGLEYCDSDATVTFSWSEAGVVNKFAAAVTVCKDSGGVKDLSSPEYQIIANNAFADLCVNSAFYVGNNFCIKVLETEEELALVARLEKEKTEREQQQ